MSGAVGSVSGGYTAPVDFRVGQTPPVVANFDDVNSVNNDIYASLQQMINALVNYCGIGPQLASNWSLLAGSSKTLLSGNLRRFYAVAAETVNQGAIISLTGPVGGAVQIRNANATNNTRIADGFCSTTGGITAGASGEVILGSGVVAINGLTPGQRYWLSTTNGLLQNVPATAAGNVEQILGIAIDATHFWFNTNGFWIQH